jgi:hypothetical protein
VALSHENVAQILYPNESFSAQCGSVLRGAGGRGQPRKVEDATQLHPNTNARVCTRERVQWSSTCTLLFSRNQSRNDLFRHHGRKAWGGHGLPEVSPGPTMPYTFTPCGRAIPLDTLRLTLMTLIVILELFATLMTRQDQTLLFSEVPISTEECVTVRGSQ